MKKFAFLIFAAVLLLCLSSCQKSENNAESGGENGGFFSDVISKIGGDKKEKTTTTTMPAEEASHLAEKIENGRFDSFDSYNEEEKEKIKEYVEKDGYTLKYNKDGSGTLSNEEGEWFIGRGWVENDYTRGVPPIDFGTITMSSEYNENGENYYIFLIKNSTVAVAEEYVGKLAAAGFKDTGESQIDADAGVVVFCGKDDSGRLIEAAYSPYGFTVKIFLKK